VIAVTARQPQGLSIDHVRALITPGGQWRTSDSDRSQNRRKDHGAVSAMRIACGGLFLLLAACVPYRPLALAEQSAPASSVAALHHPAGLDLSKPVDGSEITLLAVENNPELIAARSQRGVAQAEVLAAGVLPNPTLAASYGPAVFGPDGYVLWAAGLTEDIRSLVTLSTRRRAAVYAERQARQTCCGRSGR
jgi:hypothetical protein